MRIGITYDLKDDYLAQGLSAEMCAEFDSLETIDAIDAFLLSQGHRTFRIGNIEALVAKLARGERWDFVFNIAEGLYGCGREAQVPTLLDAYRIPYLFSDALPLALTLDKALTKRLVSNAGLRTAQFQLVKDNTSDHATAMKNTSNSNGTRHAERARTGNFLLSQFFVSLPFPLFVKPNAEGTGKGITARSLVRSEEELAAAIGDIHQRFHQPALIEPYLPGREFTVGITGTGSNAAIIGVMEILFQDSADPCGYTYDNKKHYEKRIRYRLAVDTEAEEAGQLALDAWRLLGCRDGGRVDIRSDAEARPHFLEVNPLAGLHPVLGDLVILARLAGLDYAGLLAKMMQSALLDASRFPPSSLQARHASS